MISRSDKIYTSIDEIESSVLQYKALVNAINIRYTFSGIKIEIITAENMQRQYIEYCKIKENINLIDDVDYFTMKVNDVFENEEHKFIKDYSYHKNLDAQIWVSIDFSLPKEELIQQISSLKDDVDSGKIEVNYTNEDNYTNIDSVEFSKSIRRKYADVLFIYDCYILNYNNQAMIYKIYDYRNSLSSKPTAITENTIKKYITKAKEILTELYKLA